MGSDVTPQSAESPGFPDLGPFLPPPNYRFEPELEAFPPRRIPPELRRGRHAQQQRNGIIGLGVAGLLCAVLGLLPVVKTWGLYVLPLKYLTWIGLGCLTLAGVAFIMTLFRRGPYRYVEQGIPLVARVCGLVLRPTVIVNTQPTTFRYAALIQYRHPDTGEIELAETTSTDLSTSAKDRFTTSYRVGDYATAVYLKSDFAKTLRLYGFLDLKPGLGLVPRQSQAEGSLVKLVATILAVFALFGVLLWNVYAFSKYEPLKLTLAQGVGPFALGGLLIGGGLLAILAIGQRRARRARAAQNQAAVTSGGAVEIEAGQTGWFGAHGVVMGIVLVAGALLLGGLTMLCWCFTANALLDRSQPELRPVAIKEFWMTTHSGVVRGYSIEYRFLDEEQTHKLLTTPDHMQQFRADAGLAEVQAGRFGWPWVRTIRPIVAGPGRGLEDVDEK